MVNGTWKPTVARVSAPYERGGLFVLNELVHENGHVANITAIRNRPAFVDWPSDLFAEAFADVPAWSTYEPVWQRRYLGHEAPEQLSLRALYSMVVLDVAWSLFELRMFRAPSTDPNALWTEITSHYLHIVPHPELSWWAVRVQLADLPGYMVNYGLGAVLTAEMRQHIAEALGPFDTGDSRWYGWLSEQLLHYGSERDTRTLMQNFIGRPVSPRALLEQIHRLKVVTLQTAGGNDDLEQLKSQLQNIRQGFPGDMAVYMKNLKTGEEIALDADSIYETFSIIKIAIMADVLRQAEAGKFSLDDRISLKAADQRLPSGVLYTMQPGLNPTIRDLITLMIIISDNAATDLLADKVGRANITGYMHELGLSDTSIKFSDLDWDRTWLSTLDPSYKNAPGDKTIQFPFGEYSEAQIQSAFGQTIYNAGIYFGHSTAREIGHLLEMIQQNKLVSKAASEFMLATLEKQQVNNRFPKYLRNVLVAHKTGDGQPFIANDAGILFVKNQPVVLVVFTGHHRGETEALHDAVARVAALVAKHYGAELSPDYKPQ